MIGPEEWLATCSSLAGGRIVRRLADGPLSQKWLLEHAERQYVLRIDRPLAALAGLDRCAEYDLMGTLAEHGVVPRPVSYANGISLNPFVPGVPWSRAELDEPQHLSAIATVLRKLHALPIVAKPFDLRGRLNLYAQISGTVEAQRLCESAHRLLGQANDGRPVVCHNDPVIGNVVGCPKVKLIDWEFAAAGNPLFDLAAVIEHHQLCRRSTALFTKHYGLVDPGSQNELGVWRDIYRLTSALWSLIVSADRPAS